MDEITDVFVQLIQQYKSIDIAEAEFKKLINEDDEIHSQYKEWCEAVGSTEKMGFFDYCEEYLESQHSIYDSLTDFDE